MLRFWRCGKGVTVSSDGSEPECQWRIGDSNPGILGPLILMADGAELDMIRDAMREHSWKGAEPKNTGGARSDGTITPIGFVVEMLRAAATDPGTERKAMLFCIRTDNPHRDIYLRFSRIVSEARVMVLELVGDSVPVAVSAPAAVPERILGSETLPAPIQPQQSGKTSTRQHKQARSKPKRKLRLKRPPGQFIGFPPL